MCIEVRVSYPRCVHVHLGYELCVEIDPSDGCCSRLETHSRIDPFCPLCSRLQYRAHRLRSAWGMNAQQQSEAMLQAENMMHHGQRHYFGQLQPPARHDYGIGKQQIADESKRPSFDGLVSDSSLFSQIHSINTHLPPPIPIEPPIDPQLLGPQQFLVYRQRSAMAVALDFRHRPTHQDCRRL